MLSILLYIAYAEQFPNITLVPLQQYQQITNFENIVEINNCANNYFDAWIDNGEQNKNLIIDNKYNNINLISTSTIQVLNGNILSYCFGALYDDTKLIFLRDNPYFFDPLFNHQAIKYDLSSIYKNMKCDYLQKTTDQQQFYLLCKEQDQSYRVFIQIKINNQCNSTGDPEDISINQLILNDTQDKSYQIISQYQNNDKYVILYNKANVLAYYCNQTNCEKICSFDSLDTITDIKSLYSNSSYWKIAILYQNKGLYIGKINKTLTEFNQSLQFQSYQYDVYCNISIYKPTNWYGNQPSFIYPELILLTSNFVYIFNILNISETIDLQLNGQIEYSNSKKYQFQLSQDDTYIYIHKQINQSHTIQYINKQKLTIQELINNFKSNKIIVTRFDLIQELSYFDNKFITIYYYDQQFRGKQVNIVTKILNINAFNFTETSKYCDIIFNNNQSLRIELIQLNSKRILSQNQTNESDGLKIILDLNQFFKGQLLDYRAKPESKRLQLPNKIQDTLQLNKTNKTLNQPQNRENYTVISSQYSHKFDKVFTLYQFPNKSLVIFKQFDIIYDSTTKNIQKGLLQNFDQIEDKLIFSIGSFDETNISTYIIDWQENDTKEIIIELNDDLLWSYQFEEIKEEKIKYCKQISQCFQKIIYFLVKTVQEKLFLIYFKYDQSERNCVQFHNYTFDDLDLTLSLYNIFVAKAKNTVNSGQYELIYFRLPINQNENKNSCFNIYPNKLNLSDKFKYSDYFDFKLLDLRFIDGYKSPALVFIDIEQNQLSLHYLKNLEGLGIFSQVTPLPLILPDNITLKDQKISYLIKQGTKFSQDFSLKYFRVIYQYLILNIGDDKSLQQIQLYNLVEQSGNQIYNIFSNQSEKNDLFILPKAYQQNPLQDTTQYVRYVQATIDPILNQTQFNNVRYYYKFSPQFQMDIAGYKELSRQIYNIELSANNSINNNQSSIAKIKFQLNGSNIAITDFQPLEIKNHTYIQLNNYQGSIEMVQINKKHSWRNSNAKNITFVNYTNQQIFQGQSKWLIDQDYIFGYNSNKIVKYDKNLKNPEDVNNTNNTQFENISKISFCQCQDISYYAVIEKYQLYFRFDDKPFKQISNDTYDVKLLCSNRLKQIYIISLQYANFIISAYSSQLVIYKFDRDINNISQIQLISSNTSSSKTLNSNKDIQFANIDVQFDVSNLSNLIYLSLNSQQLKIIFLKEFQQYYIIKLQFPEFIFNQSIFKIASNAIQLETLKTKIQYQVLNMRQCRPLPMRPIFNEGFIIGFADCKGKLEINFYFYNQSFTRQINSTQLNTSEQISYQYIDSKLRLFQNEVVLEYDINYPLKYSQILEFDEFGDINRDYQQCVLQNELLYFTCLELILLNNENDTNLKIYSIISLILYALIMIGNIIFCFIIRKQEKSTNYTQIRSE